MKWKTSRSLYVQRKGTGSISHAEDARSTPGEQVQPLQVVLPFRDQQKASHTIVSPLTLGVNKK